MFARVLAFLPLAALFVSASHLEARDSCSTGPINCCNSVQNFQQAFAYLTKHDLVAAAAAVVGDIGFNCSPISGVAVGGNSCTAQTVCCKDVRQNGLVNLGCTPINVNA